MNKPHLYFVLKPSHHKVYFVGGIHGREGIAVLTPFLFANTLYSLLKDGDQEIQYLLSTRRVFVTFSMNPDAYIDNIQIRNITEVFDCF